VKFELADIADVVNGILGGGYRTSDASRLHITSAHTDSRRCGPGDLFVAIRAERDGHDFVDDARGGGAIAWLTEREDSRVGAIRVANTEVALSTLGAAARNRVGEPVIGVTGSSGKTSTKDLIAAILQLSGPAGFSEKSFNNEFGVPLTLINSPDDARSAVIEMGARGIGHIAALCRVARPTVGVVTNVGTAHLAMYDRPDGILRAKGELVAALPDTGTAVLNFDDASSSVHATMTTARVLTFSAPITGRPSAPEADITVDNVILDAELRASFALMTPWGNADIRLSARGRHQVANAAAAAAATLAGGMSLEHVVGGLATDVLSPWRMEFHRTATGLIVLNDAYNANDQSMLAALRSLAELPSARRIAVLGTMAELGDHAPTAHRSIVEAAHALGIDTVIAVGEPMYVGADELVSHAEAAFALLNSLQLGDGDAVLVKASRVAGLERLAAQLHQGTRP
jgi:UDP-N-acetylmuramoyl-tripeptide--D-alanyl-D-alanine ligase